MCNLEILMAFSVYWNNCYWGREPEFWQQMMISKCQLIFYIFWLLGKPPGSALTVFISVPCQCKHCLQRCSAEKFCTKTSLPNDPAGTTRRSALPTPGGQSLVMPFVEGKPSQALSDVNVSYGRDQGYELPSYFVSPITVTDASWSWALR